MYLLPPDLFGDDLRKVHFTEDPMIIPEIELVVVLSGRSTVLKHVHTVSNRKIVDIEDDLKRLKKGIMVAKKICAMRANKKIQELNQSDLIIPIFYNGTNIQNNHLKIVLHNNTLPLKYQYPTRQFIIRDINPPDTIGQVQSFIKYFQFHSFIKFLRNSPSSIRHIAVISSAYHLARVARTYGSDSPQVVDRDGDSTRLGQLQIYLFGVDRKYRREGIELDLAGEHDAMVNYSMQGKISRCASKNTFFCSYDVLVEKSFRLIRPSLLGPTQVLRDDLSVQQATDIVRKTHS